ncbi:AIPR family protein [Streptococcus equi]|uniref:AIPR family protein n=1 Tax=Streptococcus equi TaxID=1336 RepID=UPI001E3923AB|nr:AIPR family protein [Streptococcus equi]MCD3368452.1 AIPR family protein [Streptococcus equi subsp. zooepidemicus]MCD3447120.1 AIPR family protein [Streptococcus equi subsp. zooepidemicus]MDI5916336.1 AIPR family protein [Streptococcus equi subsp. zooepidemicus]HEL0582112.1 AIPR family protein [Streptococcus equi subsp. zooepidemicus]HEL1344369.1 AIPR family protein [Streptococcus equi subsp. zooepidemicus]
MDRVTLSLMKDFKTYSNLPESISEDNLFEYFSCYTILSKLLDDVSINVNDIVDSHNKRQDEENTVPVVNGGGGDLGIDSLAIILESDIIFSIEELQERFEDGKVDDILIVFIQSKTSQKFDGSEIRNFGDGIVDFLQMDTVDNSRMNKFIADKIRQFNYIIENIDKVRKLRAKAYYVTNGIWVDDSNLVSKIDKVRKSVEYENLLNDFDFYPIDAATLKEYYKSINSQIEKKLLFPDKVALPDIPGVNEAYIGYINASDYLEILMDNEGELRKSLFYDNVRDYQGRNTVNSKIEETLMSSDSSKMVLLNNGITIIAEKLQVRGKEIVITNFQVVNGYQTSYTLFENREEIHGKDITVPVKIIYTTNEDLINEIIIANNSQTAVKEEELISLTKFQKELEMYYESLDRDGTHLYYERRSKQYSNDKAIEKTRIVTIGEQLKSFSAMYLDDTHMASRYYGKLKKKNSKIVFDKQNPEIMFYTSSYALYLIEYMVRNGVIDRKYRKFKYHILMLIRVYISQTSQLPKTKKQKEKMCEEILKVLRNKKKIEAVLGKLISIIDETVEDISSTEVTKTAQLNMDLKKRLDLVVKA